MPNNSFQAAAPLIDVAKAISGSAERNDLLPPRLEDGVGGEAGKRFSEGLVNRLLRGKFEPSGAQFISVPKPGHTTRPAALISLSDRVFYQALANSLRDRIELAMIGKGIAMWPRGVASPKQWRLFESLCLKARPSYVVLADVSAFYESISHEKLGETLVDLTGKRDVVDALIEFLGRTMRSSKGIPQGIGASDIFATAYLTPVDHAMARECVDYFRHGDDVRAGVATFSDGKKVLSLLERELRVRGLVLNGSKATIMKAKTYADNINEYDRLIEQTRKDLLANKISRLQGNEKAISKLLKSAGRVDLEWDFFYHGSVSFEEMVSQVSEHLSASDAEVAGRVFVDAMKRRPGTPDALQNEVFHHRVTSSLVRLAAAKSPLGIKWIPVLATISPEKMNMISSYLAAMPDSKSKAVLDAVIPLIESNAFKTDWEYAWLLRVLRLRSDKMDRNAVNVVENISRGESFGALARVEALKTLASRGSCDQNLVRRLWNMLPSVYRTDLVAAAFFARGAETWCRPFLDGVKDDPINVVVLRHLEASSKE